MAPDDGVLATRTALVSLLGNTGLAAVKLAGGLWGGSTALLADATHSGADVLASLVVWGGTWWARRPPDRNHPYGHGKAEPAAAKLVALLLMGAALWAAWESLRALLAVAARPAPPAAWAVAVAVGSLAAKEGLYRYIAAAGRATGSVALQADAWNHRTDAISSLVALVGILGARAGWPQLDPAMGLVVAGLVLRLGGGLYWRALEELMDTAPPPGVLAAIRAAAGSVPGVAAVHAVRARRHGPRLLVDLVIAVPGDVTVAAGHRVADAAADRVRAALPAAAEVLVHVDPHRGAPGP